MAYSARYRALESRVRELRGHFLPARFPVLGVYTERELDNARAFRVLIHAELENYFEERALALALRAADLWRQHRRSSRTLVSLLSNVVGEQSGLPKKVGADVATITHSQKVYSQYKHYITNNNGIKTQNILQILLPVGVIESEIDAAWLSTIDGFGTKRGAAAHSAAINYQIDPQDDFQTVNQIMQGVRDIDAVLNTLIRSMR